MKTERLLLSALLAGALAACAGPSSRIKKHQAEFDSYPADVQQKIRAGQVDVGFTDQQVAMALGRPDRGYARKTADVQQEVWAYGGSYGSHVGVGFGLGLGGGPGYTTGGVMVDPGPGIDHGERVRGILQSGVVVAVESRQHCRGPRHARGIPEVLAATRDTKQPTQKHKHQQETKQQ